MASKEAKKVDRKVREHQNSADPNQISLQPRNADGTFSSDDVRELPSFRDPVASDEQFPTTAYTQEDPRDAQMADKIKISDGEGHTPFGVLQAKDSDFEWLRRKREAEEYAQFSQWFAANFDKMDVTQKKLAKELFPTFYQERLRQLERSIALQGRIAKQKLLGIENKEDLLLQYAMEAGHINGDPLEHILHPEQAKHAATMKARRQRYARGLMNPNRLLRGDWGQDYRVENSANLTGRSGGNGDPDISGTGGFAFGFSGFDQNPNASTWEGKAGTDDIYKMLMGRSLSGDVQSMQTE